MLSEKTKTKYASIVINGEIRKNYTLEEAAKCHEDYENLKRLSEETGDDVRLLLEG